LSASAFVHLHVHGPFSFLDGASEARALAARAAELGMPALALTDHDGLSGAVVFDRACREAGVRPILGAEVTLAGGGHLTLLAPDATGYAHLCRLLTRAHLDHPRGAPAVEPEVLQEHAPHLIGLSGCRRGEVAAAILDGRYAHAEAAARRYAAWFGPGRFFLETPATRLPGDRRLQRGLRELGERLGLDRVATCDVHYARKEDFWLHDLLVCVRERVRLDALHPLRPFNAENHLQPEEAVREALAEDPAAVDAAAEVAARCGPALPPPGRRLPAVPGAEVRVRREAELNLIGELGFADYFLVVWEIVAWARRRGIRAAGRGSAADSVVAYCLGITEVDAFARGLPFERFLSRERAEVPDVDLDFDARRRDEVAAHVEERYGRDRVAAVATYHTFRARSAVRELGRALGLADEECDALARRLPYYVEGGELEAALREVPELRDLGADPRKTGILCRAAAALSGFPRHLGTHLGGLVVTAGPVAEVMPLQRAAKGVVVGQYDKRDCEALGLVKIDLLPLRTLSAVEEAVRATGVDYEGIPPDDARTFRRLRRGETVGAFQLESPAQRALHVRLGAEDLEDVIASVALIRPGPIKGNMVDPFVARRRGREPVEYPLPELEGVLRKTYGVVVFQEQVIELASRVAGFTPGEADRLRRVMSHYRSPRDMEEIGRLFVAKATARGVPEDQARAVFASLRGYASYGFPEAHAAAFGLTAYRTLYLLEHHPAAWYAALLSNQPMGFYPPHTLVNEALRRGIAVLPLDVNRSAAGWTAEAAPGEEGEAIRVGLRQVRGIRSREVEAILSERDRGPFRSPDDFRRRLAGRVARDTMARLALAGAFDGVEPHRRRALWRLVGRGGGAAADLPDFPPAERYLREVEVLGIMARGHVMAYLRPRLEVRGVLRTDQARSAPDGERIAVAGLAVRPHRPPTRSGRRVVFLSLEDETGLLDAMVPAGVYRRDGAAIFPEGAGVLLAEGRVRRRGQGASLVADRVQRLGGGGGPGDPGPSPDAGA
jgi:error-prone DNA polymerase